MDIERDKEFVQFLDAKIEELKSEMMNLLPVYREYQILTNRINMLRKVQNEFREEGKM